MGLFTSSAQPKPPAPTPSTDGGFIAPDRTARAQCWEGRDAFFACLDAHSIIDSVKDDAAARKACGKEAKMFEANCAESWVVYFKKRRVFEHQKAATLKRLEDEGAKPLDGASGGDGAGAAALKGR